MNLEFLNPYNTEGGFPGAVGKILGNLAVCLTLMITLGGSGVESNCFYGGLSAYMVSVLVVQSTAGAKINTDKPGKYSIRHQK